MWKGMSLVPSFLDVDINGANYLEMLKECLVLHLRQKRVLSKIRF